MTNVTGVYRRGRYGRLLGVAMTASAAIAIVGWAAVAAFGTDSESRRGLITLGIGAAVGALATTLILTDWSTKERLDSATQ